MNRAAMRVVYVAIPFLLLGSLLLGAAQATILEVGPSGYPYSSLQTAINDALTGDTVLVHDGTYYEKINFSGKAITVKSANGPASTFIDGSSDGTVVTFENGESSGSVLDGFTIRNGNGFWGGGILCLSSSPTITNCTISGNSASSGGGIYCTSSPTITNCTISGNWAGSGGGIYCYQSSSATITNCTISGNSASSGGGIYCYQSSSPTISNCTITGNWASYCGGIYCILSSPTIINCTITENQATSSSGTGAGIYCEYFSSPTITNCTISGNWAVSGGGIYCYQSSSPTITNCTITGNWADYGGGIYCYNSSPTITNSTITGNTATFCGGGIYCEYSSSPTVKNSILWGDICDLLPTANEIWIDSSSITIIYSDIQGGYAGTGNINADPMFVDPTNGDLHLKPFSPCIDAGDNSAPNLPLTDIDGEDRKIDDPGVLDTGNGLAPIVDMGAHEYSGISKIGDINGDSQIDMSDAILGLKTSAGILPGSPVSRKADVNGDGKIGMEEVIYVLHMVSGLRE